jgi:hypothetical protein
MTSNITGTNNSPPAAKVLGKHIPMWHLKENMDRKLVSSSISTDKIREKILKNILYNEEDCENIKE